MSEAAVEATLNILESKDSLTSLVQQVLEPLNGLGSARSSALELGFLPSLSSSIMAAFCTSFVHNDDIVCLSFTEIYRLIMELTFPLLYLY
jgi:hypothetical protein